MKKINYSTTLWSKPHKTFIAVSFGFSWLIWIFAWLIAKGIDAGSILFNANLIWLPFSGGEGVTNTILLISLLSLTGVYGPMLGAYVASRFDNKITWRDIWNSSTRWRGNKKYFKKILVILALVVFIPLIITILFTEATQNAPGLFLALLLLLLFFVLQIITSGTEELGWRGYLTEKLLTGRDFWDVGWIVGAVWALWHFPVVVIMFMQQGMVHVQIIGSLAGFTMGIIAMSILHTWFYSQARQVSLNIFIHALFNAIPLTLTLFYIESPVAFLSNIFLWFVVIYIKYRYDKNHSQVVV